MYIYSDIVGTFVFNQNFKIREKVLFTKEQALENIERLENVEVLDSEKKFLDKFKNIENLRETKDRSKLHNIKKELSQFKEKYREHNIFITKNQISDSVNKDILIVQTISSIEELGKIVNLMTKRLREWYSYYLPELDEEIEDNEAFVRVLLKTDKNSYMQKNKIRVSMGGDFGKKDISKITDLAKKTQELNTLKNDQEKYLEDLMRKYCPNMTHISGPLIGAKLISIAGSLRKMVMFPASTIQLLGAEKALFRHMKNKNSRPPKYGVVFQHPLIQKTKKGDRGKVARLLADKISLAVKVDYFKGDFVGDKLKAEIEEKIKEMK